MNEVVSAALSDAFPDRTVAEVSEAGPSWNGANETFGVEFRDGGRAFCKVATDGNGTRIAREQAVLRYVSAERQIRVPTVLAADRNGSPPYLVTEPVSGRELSVVWNDTESRSGRTGADGDVGIGNAGDGNAGDGNAGDGNAGDGNAGGDAAPADVRASCVREDPVRESLLRRVGRMLAALHAERFDGHGEIVGAAGGGGAESPDDSTLPPDTAGHALAIEPAPWPDVLRSTVERTRGIGTTERLAGHYEAVIDCVESNRDRLTDAPAALLHGDVAMQNLFVVDGIAAIDWELAHVGDPARDLVRAEDQLLNGFDSTGPERYAAALHGGYRERAGGLPEGFAERRPIYEVVRMLGRSGFLDQWATHLNEPIDALADRAEAELRTRLAVV
ncbi:phosphotransferase family protein [Halorubrum sp. BV1]|uniref:phosphotransferase family protein n=1 Tax=Halorubrum sp. BV1 TaxID=1498500 RepID=UPI000678FDFE|nr:aminoglycoside phosphotransferase family protein [Halorubrum sp. BV1]